MNGSSSAVFLSYASQDAEAARRICETLRGAGVEVWFDADGGLEHGDEWDAKIRRQIKECVLFIPIISASTQARHEGYFRIEWELAAQRAMGIASGIAFILPVVIDDTREPEALVPDRFRAVQWTKLPGGVVTPEVKARYLKLWSHRMGAQAAVERGLQAPPNEIPNAPTAASGDPARQAAKRRWLVAGVVATVAFFAVVVWLSNSKPQTQDSKPTPAPAATTSEAEQLIARATGLFETLGYTREKLAVAEDCTRKATEIARDSAQAWAARARVHAAWVLRGWDVSEKRRQETQEFARRSLALDPNEGLAMLSLTIVLHQQRAYAQAEAMARRALELRPRDRFVHSSLATAIDAQGRAEEALALQLETTRLFPGDPLIHYQLANIHQRLVRLDDALASYETAASLSAQPFAGALLRKTLLLAGWKGDLAAARSTLELLPPAERTEDRAVGVAMWLGTLERNSARVQAAAGLTARTYFEDSVVPVPKAWFSALAWQADGKTALALQQWRAAEAAIRQHWRDNPDSTIDQAKLAVTLAWSGRADEAAREIATWEAAAREQPRSDLTLLMALYYAGLGDAARAVPYLRQAVNRFSLFYERSLPLDPWWDKIRAAPEFTALVASFSAKLPATTSKSIAVLAFDNLSGDKDNEFFSDGISEELLNVLARVPGLRVAARTSAFYFKGRQVPLAEIAKQLGVAYLVEGSVRKMGSRVRITAKLVNAADGFQVWASDNLDRELKDIFAVQDEIAGVIAKNLQLTLGTAPRTTRIVNPEAHRLVFEGRHYWNQRGEANLALAETAYARALQIDPGFAQARAGLADVWTIRAWYREMDNAGEGMALDLERAKGEVLRARELDATMAEPYASLGIVHFIERRLADAEQAFGRAFQLNPNYAVAHHWHSMVSMAGGRLDRALAELQESVRLDPLSPNALWSLAAVSNYAGRHAEALKASEESLRIRPGFAPVLAEKTRSAWALQRRDEALAAARELVRDFAKSPVRWWADSDAIYVLYQAGLEAEASAHLERVLAAAPAGDYRRALALAAAGRGREALETMTRLPTVGFHRVSFHRMWDPLREDSGFQAMVARLGFAEEYRIARATLAQVLGEGQAIRPRPGSGAQAGAGGEGKTK